MVEKEKLNKFTSLDHERNNEARLSKRDQAQSMFNEKNLRISSGLNSEIEPKKSIQPSPNRLSKQTDYRQKLQSKKNLLELYKSEI